MMKFVVSSNTLFKELQLISGVLNSSNALPILDDFLFQLKKNQLSIFASDIETSINTSVEVESTDTGEITIPAKLLMEMLKNFADQPLTFKIDTDKYSIEINSESGKFKSLGTTRRNFPRCSRLKTP